MRRPTTAASASTSLLVAVLLAFLSTSCSAQPAAPVKDAPAKDAESTADEAVSVTDVAKLRQLVGETVAVRGKVSRTGKSSSGINFLNFAGTELTVVCFKENAAKFEAGAPADLFKGKDVEVTGKLERFKGKLQIPLSGPDAISLVKATAPDRGPPAKVELRELGREHWVSPAGVHYKGRDPDGRTRLDHVLRHAADIPGRDGPHGVFLGGRDGALATIDEAWQLVKKRNTLPKTDGGRSAYTVRLPRDIGFLGGQTGKRRGNPRLQSVLLVVEEGTSNLVTAYPK